MEPLISFTALILNERSILVNVTVSIPASYNPILPVALSLSNTSNLAVIVAKGVAEKYQSKLNVFPTDRYILGILKCPSFRFTPISVSI